MTKFLKQKAIIPETILWREDDGKAVLFNEQTGDPYLLNETGTRIWKLCHEGKDTGQIIETLLDEFDAQKELLEEETCELLSTLQDKELIRLQDAT